jgi:hypothetical protein
MSPELAKPLATLEIPPSGSCKIQRKQRDDPPYLAGRLRHTLKRAPGGTHKPGLSWPVW